MDGTADASAGGLEAVFMASRAALLRFVRARGAGDEAEDIVQELWLRVIAMHPPGPIAEPLAYLYRMADNLMRDRVRARLRREKRESDWSNGFSPEHTATPDRVAIARDSLAEIERTLEALGERTNIIFRRFRIDGLPQREIAIEQGCSISAVEKHLQRAYRALVALKGLPDAAASTPQRLDIEE